MTTYESTSGSIVHVELTSEDVEATRRFFEETFDWDIERVEGMDYTTWRPPNPPGGGIIGPRDDAAGPPTGVAFDQPPSLFYVGVDDLGANRDAIVDAGGEILVEEVEVPERGLFTVFRDPGGVVEAAWEEYDGREPPVGGWPKFTGDPEPGSIVHFELYSADPGATRAFHERVFDWEFETVGEGGYTMVRPPTAPYGGVMQATDEMPVGTLVYLLVEDAETAREAIEDGGGRVLREPFDVEGGTMAVFEAPGGVVQAVWESAVEDDESVAEEERPESEIAG